MLDFIRQLFPTVNPDGSKPGWRSTETWLVTTIVIWLNTHLHKNISQDTALLWADVVLGVAVYTSAQVRKALHTKYVTQQVTASMAVVQSASTTGPVVEEPAAKAAAPKQTRGRAKPR